MSDETRNWIGVITIATIAALLIFSIVFMQLRQEKMMTDKGFVWRPSTQAGYVKAEATVKP